MYTNIQSQMVTRRCKLCCANPPLIAAPVKRRKPQVRDQTQAFQQKKRKQRNEWILSLVSKTANCGARLYARRPAAVIVNEVFENLTISRYGHTSNAFMCTLMWNTSKTPLPAIRGRANGWPPRARYSKVLWTGSTRCVHAASNGVSLSDTWATSLS